LDKETDDVGVYNAEYVLMKNSVFSNIGGAVIQLYRGGTDESTNGPLLTVAHCVLDNVGKSSRNRYNASISAYGVQVTSIENTIFNNSKGIKMHLVVGDPKVSILNTNFFATDKLKITGEEKYSEENSSYVEPKFIGNYELSPDSPLVHKGTDGLNIGLIQKI